MPSNIASLVLALTLLCAPLTARAQESEFTNTSSAFDRPFALAAYVSGWAGSYSAGGIGGRARWEPFAELGVEVFGEGHIVEWSEGIRHDHQIGFNLYIPIALTNRRSLRHRAPHRVGPERAGSAPELKELERKERLRLFDRALASLDESKREVLILFEIEEVPM